MSIALKRLVRCVNDRRFRDPEADRYVGLEHIRSWTGEIMNAGEVEPEGLVGVFARGDILFGKLRPYLAKVAAPDFDGVCSTEALILRPQSGVDGAFLRYVLVSKDFIGRVDAATFGVKMPRASWETIGRELVLAPDLPTQRGIAAFLDRETARIDGLIERKREQADLLAERMRLQSAHLTTKGLSGTSLTITGIGWNPEAPSHWQPVRMASIFRESRELGGVDLPILSVSINWGISDRELGDEDRDRVVNHIADRDAYKRVRPDDLVYNMMRAWQGGFGVARVDGLVSPAYVVARPMAQIHAPFFEPLVRSPQCVEEFRKSSKGIVDFRLRLYWEHFRQVQVALPPFAEQVAIAAEIARQAHAIEPLSRAILLSIERLREHRAALINAAVTGAINVDAGGRGAMKADRDLENVLEGA